MCAQLRPGALGGIRRRCASAGPAPPAEQRGAPAAARPAPAGTPSATAAPGPAGSRRPRVAVAVGSRRASADSVGRGALLGCVGRRRVGGGRARSGSEASRPVVYAGTAAPAPAASARTAPSRRPRSRARARRAGRGRCRLQTSGADLLGREEPDGDPGRDAEAAGHQRHRGRELLAVAARARCPSSRNASSVSVPLPGGAFDGVARSRRPRGTTAAAHRPLEVGSAPRR